MKKLKWLVLACASVTLVGCGTGNASKEPGQPKRAECIAPAKPGGGFDMTCKLLQSGFKETAVMTDPMRVTYMPGGVGAVAYNKIVNNDPANNNAVIAFSTGSLLNLAQGKFGNFTEKDVKWLSGIAVDYGLVAVHKDSPLKTLDDLMKALRENPKKLSFGGAGSVGGQDWMQTAILAKKAGINPADMSYVALEGGGEVLTSLLGQHIQVGVGNVSEVGSHLQAGSIRVLAVFSKDRLEGKFANLPTAIEQGYDLEWPVIRGFYMGPKVSDEAYGWWKNAFDKMMADQKFDAVRENQDLLPFEMTGKEIQAYVYKQTNEMRQLSEEYKLSK
ncbi:tripartite tricarboxylate transporter substrate binding protein [Acinetobacter sp. ASP199]|uniref:Bug family tripartite tricarboxylate transporter substrate binding protein n=1 Tax=unclassified Acinetobacter TaxID=196816 RepID=UPI001F60314A|nr:tripartite tricarboxylate transporter substrate binding protein [Acinetobacter sp. ASP199]UNT58355.1 tripartite tricarboxylate transporter substrate binding protein [Acinetobacter sp. ASP199]